MHVFAFLNLEHPPVAWAVMRGMMVSADHASPSANQGFISFMQAGMIEHQNNARIFNESIIEGIRNVSFANRVSRIRGLYFFPSRAEAEARIGDRDWPRFFSAQNLLELELHCDTRPTIVDANWITFAPRGADGRINTNDLTWVTRYWAGEPFNDCPVWELLANGVALILDTDVRRRCFELVKRVFHESHIPILMSRLASEAGTRGGLITPFLLSENDQHVRLVYLWSDAEFRDPAVIEKIAAHPDCGCLHRLMAENEEWNIPDFSPWGRVFQLGAQSAEAKSIVVPWCTTHEVRRVLRTSKAHASFWLGSRPTACAKLKNSHNRFGAVRSSPQLVQKSGAYFRARLDRFRHVGLITAAFQVGDGCELGGRTPVSPPSANECNRPEIFSRTRAKHACLNGRTDPF